MTTAIRLVKAVAIAAVFCVVPAAQAAAIDAISVTGGTKNGYGVFSLGWEFSVNSDVYVTALGIYDTNSDGQTDGQRVRIYNKTTNTVVVTVAVASSATPELVGGYNVYYQTITPVVLTPGSNYIIAAELVQPYDDVYDASIVTASEINYITGQATTFNASLPDSVGGFTIQRGPSQSFSGASFIGPNFKFTDIPEPATLSLLAMGAVATLLRRRMHRASR